VQGGDIREGRRDPKAKSSSQKSLNLLTDQLGWLSHRAWGRAPCHNSGITVDSEPQEEGIKRRKKSHRRSGGRGIQSGGTQRRGSSADEDLLRPFSRGVKRDSEAK